MQKISLFRPLAPAFTLIELMIVIAIIAILATVAIPSYNSYTQKAALSELLQASASYKSDVELCIYHTGALTNCSGGSNGIQANKTSVSGTKYLNSISVANGVITVSGKGSLNGYGYTLTPTYSNNTISWSASCSGTDTSLFPANFCTATTPQG
ncbi:prepilin-type N-terminal cleavage/methylation domain-containing protein [Mannheimia granulomatis]|uniref:prepilin-type N-terminal cleavage/methylation domain-containing protein n=1 Tax=Mannheimia granulomatis TaxID=85402 RepID=UPI00159E8973|nr:prepilin-type N-terminal cleavage/methylation domain-containing protein [Mannheimia granulomatis]QLB14551.1 prepilin-type N-terminal cleavage/methylation domain-containing protein [Mannheimia granulomatis]